MSFSAPAGVRWEGVKPIVVMSRPLERTAQELKSSALDLHGVSDGLAQLATAIGPDGKSLTIAVLATSEQALRVIAEAEKTLRRLTTTDLPAAMTELRTAAKNLDSASAQVETVSSVGPVVLAVGLTLAGWCFLNSVSILMLVKGRAEKSDQESGAVAKS
jgi:hypothetical protein